MAFRVREDQLTPAEASLLRWQFGGGSVRSPYLAAFWSALSLAWDQAKRGDTDAQTFIERLAVPGAFIDEVAAYRRFQGAEGEIYWLDLLQRAGLRDRRQNYRVPLIERRQAPGSKARP